MFLIFILNTYCTILHPLELQAILSHDAHGAVLRRFGRYPHRNLVLGRPSTPEDAVTPPCFVHGG